MTAYLIVRAEMPEADRVWQGRVTGTREVIGISQQLVPGAA